MESCTTHVLFELRASHWLSSINAKEPGDKHWFNGPVMAQMNLTLPVYILEGVFEIMKRIKINLTSHNVPLTKNWKIKESLSI